MPPSAGFVVVQDRFLTRTARRADVVLPVAILGDREGSLVGADGVRRRLDRVRTPLQPLPQDGQLFVELARRLGAELPQGEALDAEIPKEEPPMPGGHDHGGGMGGMGF